MITRILAGLFLAHLAASALPLEVMGGVDPAAALDLNEESRIKGFRVPNYDDEGVMTSQIFGEYAEVLADGNLEIAQLRVEFYSYEQENRLTAMTVTAPLCFYNRNQGLVMSDGPVRVSRDGFVLTGTGFTFSNENQQFRILKDTRVVAQGASKRLISEGDSQ